MRRSIRFIALVASALAGCAETKEVTLYLQDLTISGPATNPPVHITAHPGANELHIVPRIAFGPERIRNGRIDGHTRVNRDGEFQVDTVVRSDSGIVFQDPGNVNTYDFKGENLRREFPSYSLGLDVDLGLSKAVALSLGAHYTSMHNQGLWTYRAGLGLRQHRGSVAWRLDLGWQWEEFLFEAHTIVSERPLSSSVSTVTFYRDEGKESYGRLYGSLVLNSVREDWSANVFLQIGLTGQRLSEIQPEILQEQAWVVPPYFVVPASSNIVDDRRGKYAASYLHIAPGLYFTLDEGVRIITGLRFSVETTGTASAGPALITPFLQFDLRL